MSVSGLPGTRRLCLLLFTTSSSRSIAASVLSRSLMLSGPFVRSFASRTVIESEARTSFTVSYFMNSCGFSLESAKFASKYVSFESPLKPDLVINLLKEEGFTDAQIFKIIKDWPQILVIRNTKQLISSKLEFFRSHECSNADIVDIFSKNPVLLRRSLESCIVPCYDIIKSILLCDRKAIKCFFNIRHTNLSPAILAQNIQEMRDRGVPSPYISLVIRQFLSILFQRPPKFYAILNEVEKMGFDPLKSYFVLAAKVLSQMSKLTVESKLDVLERFGLSREEAWTAFLKQPMIMYFSVEKITKVMEFLLNQIQRKSRDIVQCPNVFLYSLEKRTMPRCYVAHVLVSKGLEKELSLGSLLGPVEKVFLRKYVTKYQGTVPQLHDIYKGKLSFSDL